MVVAPLRVTQFGYIITMQLVQRIKTTMMLLKKTENDNRRLMNQKCWSIIKEQIDLKSFTSSKTAMLDKLIKFKWVKAK